MFYAMCLKTDAFNLVATKVENFVERSKEEWEPGSVATPRPDPVTTMGTSCHAVAFFALVRLFMNNDRRQT
jgi:hypothetical protein